jgi:hypothetical protein
MLDPMQADAYGMLLVHYPIVLWPQYWLFDFDVPAIAKALIAFVLSVILSWAVMAPFAETSGRDKGTVRSPEIAGTVD